MQTFRFVAQILPSITNSRLVAIRWFVSITMFSNPWSKRFRQSTGQPPGTRKFGWRSDGRTRQGICNSNYNRSVPAQLDGPPYGLNQPYPKICLAFLSAERARQCSSDQRNFLDRWQYSCWYDWPRFNRLRSLRGLLGRALSLPDQCWHPLFESFPPIVRCRRFWNYAAQLWTFKFTRVDWGAGNPARIPARKRHDVGRPGAVWGYCS